MISKIIVFLLLIVTFVSCAGDVVSPGIDTAQLENSSTKREAVKEDRETGSFRIQSFYPETTTQFLVPPSLFGNEVIFSDSETYHGNKETNTTAVDLDQLQEKDLGFYYFDVQADQRFYYWIKYQKDSVHIMRTDKNALISEALHELDPQINIMPRLSYHAGYLVWVEVTKDQKWVIKKFNCESFEVGNIAETNYMFSPYYKVKVKDNFVAYVQRENGYAIYYANLDEPQNKTKAITVPDEPKGLVCDGKTLAWCDSTGVYFIDLVQQEKTKVAPNGVDIDILCERYLVYMSGFQIHVYDMDTKMIVFQTNEDEGNQYIQWFNTNENSTAAVFSGWRKEEADDICFIATLRSEKIFDTG